MADAWVAECAPCTWGSTHATQDEAIEAAEQHIETLHRKVSPAERTAQRIGHVQFRTVTAADTSAAEPEHPTQLPVMPPLEINPLDEKPEHAPATANPKRGEWPTTRKK